MFIPVQNKRIYQHVVEQIQEMILDGRLSRGDRLPSERTMAEQFAVSRNSVREAIRTLEIIGIIESRQQLVIMATTDVLTGLCNRRNFYLESEKLAKLSMRGARPLCLLMLDIDFFKKINDTYGHDAGVEILRQFAVVGQSAVRSTDIFARFGGEEFVLLLPDTDVATAEVVAERLRAQIEASCTNYEDKCIRFTCSIGLADNGSEYSIDEMLKRADGGLYTAKQQGRNQVVRVLL